jgi:hypothetical protein
VPHAVSNWLLSENQRAVVYCKGSEEHHLYNRDTQAEVVVWKEGCDSRLIDLAIHPDAARVAFLGTGPGGKPFLLVVDSGGRAVRLVATWSEIWFGSQLAWSKDGRSIYVKTNGKYFQYGSLETASPARPIEVSRSDIRIHNEYARFKFGDYRRSDGPGWAPAFSQNRHFYVAASVSKLALIRSVTGGEDGKATFAACFPGPFAVGTLPLRSLSLIGESPEFTFESDKQLFLGDLTNQRIGMIADGWNAARLSSEYRRDRYF